MSEPVLHNADDNLPDLHVDRYESAWIRISLIVTVIFALAVVTASVSYGIQVPGVYARIDPRTLMEPSSPFANPQLREIAPGKYDLYVRAQVWSFAPLDPLNPLHIPAGSEVTFYVTSMDVQHGFKIVDTNVNMMVLPGQISRLTTTFDKPGTYNVICHEYCGSGGPTIGHHTMYGVIIVDPAPAEAM
ncbi:MAG: cytochrome C oxidase subunit II [Chloroflexi bacterium]|nr:MAG: cytochrome C oxidase subunit II [Chloroflexota bacterium]